MIPSTNPIIEPNSSLAQSDTNSIDKLLARQKFRLPKGTLSEIQRRQIEIAKKMPIDSNSTIGQALERYKFFTYSQWRFSDGNSSYEVLPAAPNRVVFEGVILFDDLSSEETADVFIAALAEEKKEAGYTDKQIEDLIVEMRSPESIDAWGVAWDEVLGNIEALIIQLVSSAWWLTPAEALVRNRNASKRGQAFDFVKSAVYTEFGLEDRKYLLREVSQGKVLLLCALFVVKYL